MPYIEDGRFYFVLHGRWYGKEGQIVQVDYDYPGAAEACGWSLRRVQIRKGEAVHLSRRPVHGKGCDHRSTDGTVDCRECGVSASSFIEYAGDFLRENARY